MPSAFTSRTGSITDRAFVASCLTGADAVIHAATLHKPHVATHSRQDFVDANITGTLNLLEEAVAQGVGRFVFTSTTSVFGRALSPAAGAPAAWIDEDVPTIPKNIYGVTKLAAENLCELFHLKFRLPCLVLLTSRFFPEDDDNAQTRSDFDDSNAKTNEFLNRRVDIEDAVSAHLSALECAPDIGSSRYIISATTPLKREDLQALRDDAPAVVERRVAFEEEYQKRGWSMFGSIDRVYDNARAREELGWRPRYDFESVIARLRGGEGPLSALAGRIGAKGYHDKTFKEGPYTVE